MGMNREDLHKQLGRALELPIYDDSGPGITVRLDHLHELLFQLIIKVTENDQPNIPPTGNT